MQKKDTGDARKNMGDAEKEGTSLEVPDRREKRLMFKRDQAFKAARSNVWRSNSAAPR